MIRPLALLAAPALLLGGVAAAPATATTAPLAANPAAWAPAAADQYRGRYDSYRPGRAERQAQRRYERQVARERRYDELAYQERYRRCDNGIGGAAIGAVGGGLIGNGVARRGQKTGGTIVGALLGGVVGHVVDKADDPCRGSRTRGYRR